ncbi:hypothetical protein C8Q80DRAFT_1307944 [Daedaleopsis nitida]|nr:hypothetical protein C8Q80DRAFT_1307944 [Daedaleopsis nitida]
MGNGSSKSKTSSQSYKVSGPSRLGSHLRVKTSSPELYSKDEYESQPPPSYDTAVSSESDSKDGYLSAPVENSKGLPIARLTRPVSREPSRTRSDHNPFLRHSNSGAGSSSAGAGTSNRVNKTKEEARAEWLQSLKREMRKESYDNALDLLRGYNTVIIVDDSGSMAGSRWKEARSALGMLASLAAEYDADGIDIFFLNDDKEGRDIKSAEAVFRLFDSVTPSGRTPIGMKLHEVLSPYLDSLDRAAKKPRNQRPKPVNYLIVTDGVPTDDPESVIIAAAKRLDAGNHYISQVGIQFVQIGNDSIATRYLDKLDSQLEGVRDIVDTTPYLGEELTHQMLLKILVGGINRRIDRQNERPRG